MLRGRSHRKKTLDKRLQSLYALEMNIFVLDYHPVTAAKWLCDRHVVKMCLEASQILSNAFTLEQLISAPHNQKGNPRKHSYPHHPCCKWVQQSRRNIEWLISHAYAIDCERQARFNPNAHFVIPFIQWCEKNVHNSIAPNIAMTPFVLAMPDEYKCNNVISSYRNYYRYGKAHLHHWRQNKPDWLV